MKRFFSAVILSALIPVAAWASSPIMFTQPSGRGTGNDMWVELTRSGFERQGMSHRYEVGTCATSIKAWNDAGERDPAVMLYSSNWARTALQTGQPCLVEDLDRITVYAVVRTPWWVCRNKTKSRPLNEKGIRVGYHGPSTPGEDIIADVNASNGYDWKGVVTKGSGANLMLLMNGEIDLGFMASPFARRKVYDDPNSPLECVMSWKQNDSIPYFKDVVKMKGDPSGLLYYTQLIIGKNLTAEQDRQLREIFDAKKNPQYQDWLKAQASVPSVPTNSYSYLLEFMARVKSVMANYQK